MPSLEILGRVVALKESNVVLITLGNTPDAPVTISVGKRVAVLVRARESVAQALLRVAPTAHMRKLLIILNEMVRQRAPWSSAVATAGA